MQLHTHSARKKPAKRFRLAEEEKRLPAFDRSAENRVRKGLPREDHQEIPFSRSPRVRVTQTSENEQSKLIGQSVLT